MSRKNSYKIIRTVKQKQAFAKWYALQVEREYSDAEIAEKIGITTQALYYRKQTCEQYLDQDVKIKKHSKAEKMAGIKALNNAGLTKEEIAKNLGISFYTVRNYLKEIEKED